jgi:hypothetical protein
MLDFAAISDKIGTYMSDTAAKARAMRLDRLRSMLEKKLENPLPALETLMAELRVDEAQPELWEGLHAAAVRDGKERDLADAYRKFAADRRLRKLSPAAHSEVLMHAADFFQGILGDGEGAEGFLCNVLDVAPGHAEAFNRLERRFEAAGDELKVVELYATVAATPPKPPDELARRALKVVTLLSAKTPLSDDGCRGLLSLVPANSAILNTVEAHCRKTGRVALACELLERAIEGQGLSEVKIVEQHRRLIDLYMGEANAPAKAISHVADLLRRDPSRHHSCRRLSRGRRAPARSPRKPRAAHLTSSRGSRAKP